MILRYTSVGNNTLSQLFFYKRLLCLLQNHKGVLFQVSVPLFHTKIHCGNYTSSKVDFFLGSLRFSLCIRAFIGFWRT